MNIVSCPGCGKSNRIDPQKAKVGRIPTCGVCSAKLFLEKEPKTQDTSAPRRNEQISPFLKHRVFAYGAVTEKICEDIMKGCANKKIQDFIKDIQYPSAPPWKNMPDLPAAPKSPTKPWMPKPIVPTISPLPEKPIMPAAPNMVSKTFYALQYASWEKKCQAITASNEALLRPYKSKADFQQWEDYEEKFKAYEESKKKWDKIANESHAKAEREYERAYAIWQKQKNEYEDLRNLAVQELDRLGKSALSGDSAALGEYLTIALHQSIYPKSLAPEFSVICDIPAKLVLIEFYVTSFSAFKVKRADGRNQPVSAKNLQKLYDSYVYGIILRSACEVSRFKQMKQIQSIAMNVKTKYKSPSTGRDAESNLASIMIASEDLSNIDVAHVDPHAFFKRNKGVAASSLADTVEVPPIIKFDKKDNRFVDGRIIVPQKNENLAEMDWEDFEHLVRQLFEAHFKGKNAEVRVTRSSRDRGVDAIIFDSDPITGGKIVIQAKRYTNTVEVAAVRELFGTTQNEGANKGILVTTSNYGADSYEFAKDKNLTLINGAQFLTLLKEHGFSYNLDIDQARRNMQQKTKGSY